MYRILCLLEVIRGRTKTEREKPAVAAIQVGDDGGGVGSPEKWLNYFTF